MISIPRFCSSRTSLRDSSVEARYVAFDVFLPSTRNWNKSKSASVSRKLMFALMLVHQLWGLGFASKLGMPAVLVNIPVSCCPQSSKETKAMSLAAHLLCSWCWSRPSPIRLLHTWVFKRFPTSTTTVTSSHNISRWKIDKIKPFQTSLGVLPNRSRLIQLESNLNRKPFARRVPQNLPSNLVLQLFVQLHLKNLKSKKWLVPARLQNLSCDCSSKSIISPEKSKVNCKGGCGFCMPFSIQPHQAWICHYLLAQDMWLNYKHGYKWI